VEVKYGTSARISKPALAVALNPFKPSITPAAYARAPLPDVADIFADEKARAAPAPRPPPAPDDAYDWIPVEED